MAGTGFQEAPSAFGAPINPLALDKGAQNLLLDCAELQAGQRLVVLHEDPALGWFDYAAPAAVARCGRALGAEVGIYQVGGPDTPLPTEAEQARMQADIEVWFARLGDQDRFCPRGTGRICVVSYARTAQALASGFGTRPHGEMLALKYGMDAVLAEAEKIEITCPLGTELHGSQRGKDPEDVTVRRFPMCVHRPVPACGFTGTVALTGFLTPTGSRSYTPASIPVPGVVMAQLENGNIVGLDGDQETVGRVRQHYEHVSARFGIDPQIVHSWHAGIHVDCAFDQPAAADPDLWSNSIFGSPRWLHFHTCGNYAPGEVCWMVENPTVLVNGRAVLRNGQVDL